MTPVRPPALPSATPVSPVRNEARSAAQRAFFEAALGKATAPTQASAADEAPRRIPRPGSILDIRV